MSLIIGVMIFLLAALAVRHTAYLLLRGSIFDGLRKWIKMKGVEYRKTARLGFLAGFFGKMDELFGCYVCMTSQLAIWLVAVPTTVVAFIRYGNPVSVIFGGNATFIGTMAMTILGTFILAMAVAAMGVVWWHTIDWVETHRTDRLNAESAARELALSQDAKLRQLANLVAQLEGTINDLRKTVEEKSAAIATTTTSSSPEKPEAKAPKSRVQFVKTRSGKNYIFVDSAGNKVSHVIKSKAEAMDYYDLEIAYRYQDEGLTEQAVLEQIKQAFRVTMTSSPSNGQQSPDSKKFGVEDAQELARVVGDACDYITWCGVERRDCRQRKTREFMEAWARERNIELNGVSEKAGQMMADFFRTKERGHKKNVDIAPIWRDHFSQN